MRAHGAGHGLPVAEFDAQGDVLEQHGFDQALIVGPGVQVPWSLVPAGWQFIGPDRWEVAAPLFERDLADDLGTRAERRASAKVLRDLRVPVYACELLFVRDCDGTRALLDAWGEEQGEGLNVRLAFLRALYRVKPLFLSLPRSWLREAVTPLPIAQRATGVGRPALVHLELAPGRYVCCPPDEVEKYRARYAKLRAGRRN